MSQSNSGGGACGVTASGKRKDGVDIVVDQLRYEPGLDGFCIAWRYAGGEIRNGQLVGMCKPLPPDRFAAVLSMQKRVIDAKAKGLIVPCDSRAVLRKHSNGKVIRAETYKLPGALPVGVGMSRPDRLPPPPVTRVDPDVSEASSAADCMKLLD